MPLLGDPRMGEVMGLELSDECGHPLKSHPEGTHGSCSRNGSNPHLVPENISGESSSSDYPSENSMFTIPASRPFEPGKCCRALSFSTSFSAAMTPDWPPYIDDNQSELSLKDCNSGESSIISDERNWQSSLPGKKSTTYTSSPIQPPPNQVMNRSGGKEGYRIPWVVFARGKSSSPVEWSMTSNESLFSIQLGSNSFSREYVFGWSSDPLNSQELSNSQEPVPSKSQSPGDAVVVELEINELEKIFNSNQGSEALVQENDHMPTKERTTTDSIRPIHFSKGTPKGSTNAQSPSFARLTEVDKRDQIKIDDQNRKILPQHHQNMQKPSPAPPSGSSKRSDAVATGCVVLGVVALGAPGGLAVPVDLALRAGLVLHAKLAVPVGLALRAGLVLHAKLAVPVGLALRAGIVRLVLLAPLAVHVSLANSLVLHARLAAHGSLVGLVLHARLAVHGYLALRVFLAIPAVLTAPAALAVAVVVPHFLADFVGVAKDAAEIERAITVAEPPSQVI
ncbi:hypothetical protein SAY86_017845 [Trapa natans]|uniref:Uncharacterized protein n=1 Tax=Trapa natans TaxID=22666 RepID=A0AAN7LQ93_TRANT|nr:hypothetical protein SAY86_017845 [Trapa natans]